MTVEKIRELYYAKPFQPFVIHLADGRHVPVLSPEFLMIFPSGRTIHVGQPDETVNIIDLLLVDGPRVQESPPKEKRLAFPPESFLLGSPS